ncbi:MAG: LacI family DNA-binding transcriptional regulator [Rhodanobacter sp.]
MKGKTTPIDIAHLAGVPQATVSRKLAGSQRVNKETLRSIQTAAKQPNFNADKSASHLRRMHTGTLALLFFEGQAADESHINPFLLSMLGSISRACALQGYDLLISFQQLSDDWHAGFADSKKADGLILLGYRDHLACRDKLEKLVEHGTHVVRWGAVLPGQPGVSFGSDNVRGGQEVTAHLIERGCRRIAFLGDATSHSPESFDRYGGYVDALQLAGIEIDPVLQKHAESTEHSGYEAMRALIQREIGFDAVFAASDLIAIGAMRALGDHGLRVPQDVALAGFDDIATASFINPPLTTVLQDTSHAGAVLVGNLLRLIRGEAVESDVLPVKLKIRRSSLR